MGADDNVIPFPTGRRGRLSPTNSDVEAESAQAAVVRDLTERIAAAGVGAGDLLTALRGMTGPGSFGVFDREPGGFDQPPLFERRPERAGYVLRLDLNEADPPIWRRLRLASDLTLNQVHDILQIAMGWTDSHLHRFQMGPYTNDFQVAPFLTPFDLDEGETDGILESAVRLDEVLARPGHRLFYEYDFGDGWQHTLELQQIEPWVEGDPPATCLTGRRACPPEDVGGMPGYEEVLAALVGNVEPDDADWMVQKLEWLPAGFDPSAFDVAAVNHLLREGPVPPLERWHPELENLLHRGGGGMFTDLAGLVKRAVADWVEPDDELLARAVLRFQGLLRTVGAGITLTAAGYLPPRIVDSLYRELGMESDWYGKGNRENQTLPVLTLRESATALGLVRKANGRLSVTKLGQKLTDNPRGLLAHLQARLPLGRVYERDAGMLGLLFTAAGEDFWQARRQAGELFERLGWYVSAGDLGSAVVHAARPTMAVLDQVTGHSEDPALLAAMARLLLRRS
ncbi:MAG: plasmid pRiA4b ORF-3 family protein [Propionicimonas sp.]